MPRHFTCAEYRLLAASPLFNANWYVHQNPALRHDPNAHADPLGHYLTIGGALGYAPSATFDTAWYLQANPDVAQDGMNPLVHYLIHGQYEGRWPKKSRALVWEHHLWRGLDALMQHRLWQILRSEPPGSLEKSRAAWALARWQAWQGDWEQCASLLLQRGGLSVMSANFRGPGLLAVDACCQLGTPARARRVLPVLQSVAGNHADYYLAQANILLTEDLAGQPSANAKRVAWLNRIWHRAGVQPIQYQDSRRLALDTLRVCEPNQLPGKPNSAKAHPLVSIILPVFNAAATIATALTSLFRQTWPHLELLVVDDASTDPTWARMQELAASCPAHVSMRLLRHEYNRGAYAARNTGLAAATGMLITTHDSDDWSHPEKIARQVLALQRAPRARASVSHWVRATESLYFQRWRVEEGWVYRNVSSLMVRREVVETLGYWDEVQVNADTEYYYRIVAAYGADAIIEVLPGVPLAFGRADKRSLTQCGETHLVTQFKGSRKDYRAAFERWQARAERAEDLYIPAAAEHRPFPAPHELCRRQQQVTSTDAQDQLQFSGWFDPVWYVANHPEIQGQIIDPWEHFWSVGSRQGVDPGPDFSTTGYQAYYQAEIAGEQPSLPRSHAARGNAAELPLQHFLRVGQGAGYVPRPVFTGQQPLRAAWPTIMLCAHQVSDRVYGAERSLLDMLGALTALQHNVLVTVPSAANPQYLAKLRTQAIAVAVLPYGWWQANKPVCQVTVDHFRALLDRFHITRLHANTLVLNEPLQAARDLSIPVWVHVRELPAHDPDLCAVLAAASEQIGRRILDLAHGIVANSHCVAKWLASLRPAMQQKAEDPQPPIHIVPNTIDMATLLELPSPKAEASCCTIGMLSSNLPKKGLHDFERLAAALAARDIAAKCLLFGPRTGVLEELLRRRKYGEAPANIDYAGYADTPAQAMQSLDVVINLSHFKESFGRTVLEAMAAARPVVCYDWGALGELVVHGETGFLVPFGDIQNMAEHIAVLAFDRRRLNEMGRLGRDRARRDYSPQAFQTYMARIFRQHWCRPNP